MQAAIRKAADGTIVILGVEPDRPEVGYGYIKAAPGSDKLALAVLGFVEKPDEQTAQAYLDQAVTIGMLEYSCLEPRLGLQH